MRTGWLRVVVKQVAHTWRDVWFIPDQNAYIRPGDKLVLGGLVEVRKDKYYLPAVIVGMGWEGDEFVLNVL